MGFSELAMRTICDELMRGVGCEGISVGRFTRLGRELVKRHSEGI